VVGSGQQPAGAGRSTNQPPAPTGPNQLPLQLEPLGDSGEAIYPAFEGWGPHKDGTDVLLLGYFNRNKGQVLDIPIGPNNRSEPGGPVYGQPTHRARTPNGVLRFHFEGLRRKKLTWTLVANGQTAVVQFWKNPPPLGGPLRTARWQRAPVVKFAPDGPTSTARRAASCGP
jgi:hypothetical protein